jgi:hypothetical protein
MNIKRFEYICTLSQKNLKKYVYKELCKTHEDIIYKDGFVFAKGDFPVLLVAHLDTVHAHLPRKIIRDKVKNTLSSPNGIGGDDRCGVYMILDIVKTYNCSVVFCEDEEIGGKGAEKFVEYMLDFRAKEITDFNYIIELDRKGDKDAVFYDCDNTDFEDFITKEYFKTSYGTFSDISTIAPMFGVAAVNLSSGYYNAHTNAEYVVTTEMDTIINEINKLLDRTDTETQFEYVEAVYNKYDKYDYKRYYSEYDYYDDDDEAYYTIQYFCGSRTSYECVTATNVEEAIGKFVAIHQTVCYREIIDVTREY